MRSIVLTFVLLLSFQAQATDPGLLASSVHAGFDCSVCHGEKTISHIPKTEVPTVCGQCHASIAEEYDQSIHGTALKEGKMDVPVCTD
ncbi:MAG: multiheme c-type cytochrome, partial [bacterium]|nr:multiheme c-type cytochrome [bacterium]